jgi:hypothetical protein
VVQVEGTVAQCVAALRGVATLLRGWQIRLLAAMQQQQQYGGTTASAAAAVLQQATALPAPISLPQTPTAGGGVMSPTSPGFPGVHLPSSLTSPAQTPYVMLAGTHSGALPTPPPPAGGMLPPGPMLGGGLAALPQPRGCTFVYHLNNAQVGAVLGKGGAHIAQIRGTSGARIQLQGVRPGCLSDATPPPCVRQRILDCY